MKIDLQNQPEAPFNFPHHCFALSVRVQAALAALEGPEPWGRPDPKSVAREMAFNQLRDLAEDVHYLFNDRDSEKAPYRAALEAILGQRARSFLSRESDYRKFKYAGEWAREAPRLDEFEFADMAHAKQKFMAYVENLEKLGLYFFHMMQAATGKNLPEDYEIKMPAAEWTPILPPS